MINRILQFITGSITTTPFNFTARLGYSYEIVEVGVTSANSNGLDMIIGNEKMSYLPGLTVKTLVAPNKYTVTARHGFFEQLRTKFPGIPRLIIGEGETMSLSSPDGSAVSYTIYMIEHTGDDKPKKTDPGGSESNIKTYCAYGKQTFSIGAASTQIVVMNTSIAPAGYGLFPFAGIVLPDQTYNLLGMVVQADTGSGADITLMGLRVWKMNQSILAPDEAFIAPGYFPALDESKDLLLHLFEKPIVFTVNEQMVVDFKINNAGVGAENAIVHCIPILNLNGKL